jgi:hypothetical protein
VNCGELPNLVIIVRRYTHINVNFVFSANLCASVVKVLVVLCNCWCPALVVASALLMPTSLELLASLLLLLLVSLLLLPVLPVTKILAFATFDLVLFAGILTPTDIPLVYHRERI